MNKYRTQTFTTLGSMGIRYADCCTLVRASATLHTWAEHECNGTIQRDDATGRCYWYKTNIGYRLGRTSDRETGARKRVEEVCKRYNLTPYFQTDPRGCALYLLRPGDVPEGQGADAYYSRGIAVIP